MFLYRLMENTQFPADAKRDSIILNWGEIMDNQENGGSPIQASRKATEGIYDWIRIAFGAVFTLILVVALISKEAYNRKKDFLVANGWMLAMIVAMLLLGMAVHFRLSSKQRLRAEPWNPDRLVAAATAVLFFWQCYLTYNIFFLTDWDVQTLIRSAQSAAVGSGHEVNWYYYSIYPNNLFITFFYAVMLRINYAVGIFNQEYATMSIVVVNCLINAFSCWLVYKTAGLFVEKKLAFFGYCLAVLSVGLSSWTVICYSDALMLFTPVLSIYLYLKPNKNRWRRGLCRLSAVAIAMLGYYVKPTCAIVLIAIVLIEVADLLRNPRINKAVRLAALCVAVVIASCCANTLMNFGVQKLDGSLNKNATYGATHFLMMGLNEKAQGAYSSEDVAYSRSFGTTQERTIANLRMAKHRLQQMGVGGLLRHLHNKLLITFGDGTFAWGQEGTFYKWIPENPNSKAAPLLKAIYYNNGRYYGYLSTMQQFVWLAILLLSLASAFLEKRLRPGKPLPVLWLTILGFVAYELLFEVRARYVYVFMPVFCVLASVGLGNILRPAGKHLGKEPI